MYQGKNKTACASQRAITDAFFKLLKKESFDDISISEICKEAGVSRQTFYSLFEKKENILLYEIEHNNTMQCCHADTSDQVLCHYIHDHAAFLKVLIDHENSSLLYNTFYTSLSHVLEDYDAAFMAGGLLSVIEKSFKDQCNEQQISEIIHHMFDSVHFAKKK